MSGNKEQNLIDIDKIYKMLFNEQKYVIEFAEASIQSFSEFSENYSKNLSEKDMESLRKAGHKIKPVVQMLEIDDILEEYERAKEMLIDDRPRKELEKSIKKIQAICDQAISEFQQIIDNLK
jgi:hypothetical protein